MPTSDGLLAFAEQVRRQGPLQRVVLVHGEPKAQTALQAELVARGFLDVDAPAPGDRISL